MSAPVSQVFASSGKQTASVSHFFGNIGQLQQENDALKTENQELLSQLTVLKNSIKESYISQEAFENTKENNFKITAVKVIGLDTASDSLVINKGSADGIAENMPLISKEKVLYGVVAKVYKNFSQVQLISNQKSVVDVRVENTQITQTPVHGAVKGSNRLSFYLDLVNSAAELQENNILVTSGLEGIFPDNLLVGKITSVSKNDLKPFQTAAVQPFFDPQNSEVLFVITNYKK